MLGGGQKDLGFKKHIFGQLYWFSEANILYTYLSLINNILQISIHGSNEDQMWCVPGISPGVIQK